MSSFPLPLRELPGGTTVLLKVSGFGKSKPGACERQIEMEAVLLRELSGMEPGALEEV